jgi:ubiquinone/menaquinone biosynthesis C-methylase UbiE
MEDTPEDAARRVFGERAAFYTTSPAHTDEQVLTRLVELASPQPEWTVLDVGSGTGHTAFALAPHVAAVIGTDLTPEMLAEAERLRTARGIANVSFRVADVHRLPFADRTFELVTCRRAAHHFSDIGKALHEMRRVLCPGGRLVIDDRSVPEDDTVDACMNELDRLHDESHVREYRPSEWRQMVLDCGFAIYAVNPYSQHRPLSALTHGVSAENVARIEARLAALDDRERAMFDLREVDGVLHLNHWFVMIGASRA